MGNVGIPTKHKGRQFRSRLEARWATFFDLLGWEYEYEPFDLDGWIPDFLLLGRERVLVEIKPVVDFPEDVAAKIDASGYEGEVLILGCTIPVSSNFMSRLAKDPVDPEHILDGEGYYGANRFGWLRRAWHQASCACISSFDFEVRHRPACDCRVVPKSWSDALFTDTASLYTGGEAPIGFCSRFAWRDRISGIHDGDSNCHLVDMDELQRRWAEAGNHVQWKAPR